jgi:hypothetical protein
MIELFWKDTFMNSSLWSASRATHIKIVVISLVFSIVVVGVGISARTDNSESATAMVKANGPVLKAAKPSAITANDISTVR